jgi:REP element-mobilizing transposase RayT
MKYVLDHGRRTIRIRNYDYSKKGLYFLTFCTQEKEELFGEVEKGKMILNESGKILLDEWEKIEDGNIKLLEFCIMPNHFHGIIEIKHGVIRELPLHGDEDYEKKRRQMIIPKLVGKFKMLTAKKINILNNRTGKMWQRNYYEHIIEDREEYLKISNYIKNNPQNWKEDRFYEKDK